jgi:cytochrome c biogenesis protein ResB
MLKDGTPSITQWLFGREDMRAFSHSTGGDVKMELVDVQREEGKDVFVVAVSDSASGAIISRALLTLGEEQVINDPHADCPDCATAKAATASTDWNVTLGEKVTGYATVLSLSRNPAIPTIYFGCALMMVGLMLSFFVPRRDVWFLHDEEKGILSVAAHYRHPADRFDRTTSAVLARIEHSASSSTQGKEL